MYYVTSDANLRYTIEELLDKFFGDKAEVRSESGKLHVKFKEDAGFKDEHRYLTQEEIDQGVCGGGVKLGLDGKTFIISIEEVK